MNPVSEKIYNYAMDAYNSLHTEEVSDMISHYVKDGINLVKPWFNEKTDLVMSYFKKEEL